MNENKSSISNADSYQDIGDYWDNHDLGEVWEMTEPAEFIVDINSNTTYYPVESTLSERLHRLAQRRGVSAETLVNLWLQEKVAQESLP